MKQRLNRRQQHLIDLLCSVNIIVFDDFVPVLPTIKNQRADKFFERHYQDMICEPSKLTIVLDSILESKTRGLGESYFKGHFKCGGLQGLFEMLYRLAQTNEFGDLPVIDQIPNSWSLKSQVILNKILNFSHLKQFQVAKEHYDLPDVLFTGIEGKFAGILGSSIKYTCGDWENNPNYLDVTDALDLAQQQSLEYIINQIGVTKTPHIPVILDCGCGWGSVPKYLLETLGEGNFIYIGVTIAQNQVNSCVSRFEDKQGIHFFYHSFNDRFEPILARLGIEKVDGVIFLGSLEHAGPVNAKAILANVRQVINSKGKIYIQIVGSEHPTPLLDPYIWEYIFPNTVIMSPSQVGKIIEHNRSLRLVNIDNIYHDYYLTLMAWHENFQVNWANYEPYIADILHQTSFTTTEEWKKHWEFYLLLCASFYQAGTYPQLYRITLEANLNLVDKKSIFNPLTKFMNKVFNT